MDEAAGDYLCPAKLDVLMIRDMPRDRQISREEELDLRSLVWHCFHKVFADLPGAKKFKFKAKTAQQARV